MSLVSYITIGVGMYMVAAEIVSHISGLTFIDYVQRNIFSALPFSTGSGHNISKALSSGDLAEGFVAIETNSTSKHAEGWSKSVWKAFPLFVESLDIEELLAGAGGVFLNAKDAVSSARKYSVQTAAWNALHCPEGDFGRT